MYPAGKETTLLFRIDKTLVSYEHPDSAYTSVSTVLRPAYKQTGKEEVAEEKLKSQVLNNLETQMQRKIDDTDKKTEAMLFTAEEKVSQIVRQAEAEAARIIEEAEEKGYRNGAMKAEQEIQTRLGEQLKVLQNLITQVGAGRDAMIDELEDEMIALVFEIVKKVINTQIEKDDKIFVDLVQNVLSQMKREGKIIVRVNQDDYTKFFNSGSAEFIFNNERIKITVIEEPLFEKGDCVIESDGETVNAGINSQLKYIEFAFRNKESHIA